MWIGAIRLRVQTKDGPDSGTDNLVKATIERDGVDIVVLRLDYAAEDDLERGSRRDFDYFTLPRINDQTPKLPMGIGMSPMPYPPHGIEFSDGLEGHLTLRLQIGGDDMWIEDDVEVFVREIGQKTTGFDTVVWQEDTAWTSVGTWSQDVAMSTDSLALT